MKTRTFLKTLGLAVLLPTSVTVAQAQSKRPVRVIVPLPAGSSNDFATRVLTQQLYGILGQSFIVDNKAGGNGTIGTLDVLRAKPDGLTLMCGSNSPLAANVAFVKNLPYDPLRDFTPIAGVTLTNHVLLVKASHPARTLAEFIAYAKQRPGKVSVGSSTASVRLQIATLNQRAGIQLMDVPYRGTPASITDVMGGVLEATLTDPGNALSQVQGGQMRALGVTSLRRNPATPSWPAISETLPGFDFPSWNALVGPAGMPRDVVQRLADAVAKARKHPDVVAALKRHGSTTLDMGPEQLKDFMAAETSKWVSLARAAGIQPE
ncbi:Bug family tripartite tricarboxylate transporter substrate binding protein [Pseudoduganella umbonata]|uniref:Tripartite tricarboxylate transporter substrate binding protein n=1 Tax=Pseudoduganella umbonata TaxID=864828 RepID=A0A4P8HL92_9BURK|nr:tripartite tricarboxylate transporter substrate binding protein [Pseudoduganella umbonata]MBB3221611.1 tripartite-type tricarboxylate transporter receptor subunit TctC [Pseudoduganella umbonata]QCP09154.1 tripartite tricarboxylate transporter substrate binding protein [Pseudoduganella umbonata]